MIVDHGVTHRSYAFGEPVRYMNDPLYCPTYISDSGNGLVDFGDLIVDMTKVVAIRNVRSSAGSLAWLFMSNGGTINLPTDVTYEGVLNFWQRWRATNHLDLGHVQGWGSR